MSLLEEAKKIAIRRRSQGTSNSEEVELAVAWARGEVALVQVRSIMGIKNGGNVYPMLAQGLRAFITKNHL